VAALACNGLGGAENRGSRTALGAKCRGRYMLSSRPAYHQPRKVDYVEIIEPLVPAYLQEVLVKATQNATHAIEELDTNNLGTTITCL